MDYDGENQIYENETNEFSANLLLTKQQENEIIKSQTLTEHDIIGYAENFETHPAIIIGRLQHLKLIPYGTGNSLFNAIDFTII